MKGVLSIEGQGITKNTSGNDILPNFIKTVDNNMKQELELLLKGEELEITINTNIIYNDIYKSSSNLYSFLLLTGYLKVTQYRVVGNRVKCLLAIPNKEIFYVYQEEIVSQLANNLRFDL